MRQFQRRLTTILSADVSEYCRIMGSDDELTLVRLIAYRQIMEGVVAGKNGRMFGVAGDSWMAEFASPVEAVRCAAESQRAVESRNLELPEDKRLRFRMGVHMGDVIVGGSDLFGDEVNIAARLQQLCRPGHLVVSEAVLSHVLGKVNLHFHALGSQRLKNISVAVAAFAAEVIAADGDNSKEDIESAFHVSRPVPGFAGEPAVAVLPFLTLGCGAEDDYIGEGLAEDLINGLSNVRWFPVISRFSSFVFKNQTLDTRSIGNALGARYLVEGSVRRAGQDLRLIVNLIDAENGANLWSQRYQINFSKLFEVQDEITASIVSVLEAEVERAEGSRLLARKPEHLDTWELIRRGIWHLYKMTKEDAAAARAIFEDALKLDPGSAEARIQLAWWCFWDIWSKRGDLALFGEVERLGREAMQIDRRDARAHMIVGVALMMRRQPEQARSYFFSAVDINPSLAAAHASLGSSYILAGAPETALAPLLLSIRLNPHDLYSFHYLGELAAACYLQEQWDKACEFAERSLRFRAGYWYAKAIIIASLARSGRLDKARAFAADASCKFSIQRINWLPFVDQKCNNYLLDGLRLAGCTISEKD